MQALVSSVCVVERITVCTLKEFVRNQWDGVCKIYAQSLAHSSVQSCPTLCDPMNCSTPGLPVHHQLPESIQTHVHWVGDAIQPSHPLSSPSPPALNLSQHQGLFKWVSSLHQVAKVNISKNKKNSLKSGFLSNCWRDTHTCQVVRYLCLCLDFSCVRKCIL